jgi:hypothetical protein
LAGAAFCAFSRIRRLKLMRNAALWPRKLHAELIFQYTSFPTENLVHEIDPG